MLGTSQLILSHRPTTKISRQVASKLSFAELWLELEPSSCSIAKKTGALGFPCRASQARAKVPVGLSRGGCQEWLLPLARALGGCLEDQFHEGELSGAVSWEASLQFSAVTIPWKPKVP